MSQYRETVPAEMWLVAALAIAAMYGLWWWYAGTWCPDGEVPVVGVTPHIVCVPERS